MNIKEFFSNFFTKYTGELTSINEIKFNPNVILNANLQIGDYISISPIIDAVIQKWSDSKIYVICSGVDYDVVKCDPRVIAIKYPPKKHSWKYYRHSKKIAKDIGDVDLLIEPCKLNRSYRSIIGFLFKPKLTIGLYWDKYSCISKPILASDIFRFHSISKPKMFSLMMNSYGFISIEDNYKLFENEESKSKMSKYLEDNEISNYLVINPFASTYKRTLSLESVRIILSFLEEKFSHILILIPPYIKNIEEWRALGGNIHFPPIDNFMDSVSLVRNASVVLSVDTSIVHVSSAFDKPIVALFRGQDIKTSNWLPRSTFHSVLEIDMAGEEIASQLISLRNKLV
ncbi:glycosyltransferase family 9 protein [Shewanella baltica]|uniref:glycosyltransferase family 9 protein n=1 Tax=Shewanella baltica TaxID=62322 RepID=UPI003D7AACA4